MIKLQIRWLVDESEFNEIAEGESLHGTPREMEQRLAWTCQHWREQAIRCADQAEGVRQRAVQLGLGKFSVNERGEREFHFNRDAMNL